MDENTMPTNPPVTEPSSVPPEEVVATDILAEVAKKISEAQNVLVALSSDPSVDEMAAAIGLTLFLDRLGKRATAIYSGMTPNALEFLKPEETFEPSADALQDFVIALNKEKADHIRYKIDGDYVKIYITPYKTRIDEKNLEFAYGDYNVDLVLALDVMNGADLDSALREHGRIMHDAVVINITTGNPGKFGEIEWSNKNASSVSEMIAELLYKARSDKKIEEDDATAFLTGIVAATNRFSNAKTTPMTMQIASKLMESGANQQLISKNITPDVENELYTVGRPREAANKDANSAELSIAHGDKNMEEGSTAEHVDGVGDEADKMVVTDSVSEYADTNTPEAALLDDLKMAEASLAQAGNEVVPESVSQPVKIDEMTDKTVMNESATSEPVVNEPVISAPAVDESVTGELNNNEPTLAPMGGPVASEPVLPPVVTTEVPSEMNTERYGEMLREAIGDVGGTAATGANPAAMMAPQVESAPEVNGVPDMNYMPLPEQEVLPPPPTPPIDMAMPEVGDVNVGEVVNQTMQTTPVEQMSPSTPTMSTSEPVVDSVTPMGQTVEQTALGQQPAMQDQVYHPQAADPSAFKIPGM